MYRQVVGQWRLGDEWVYDEENGCIESWVQGEKRLGCLVQREKWDKVGDRVWVQICEGLGSVCEAMRWVFFSSMEYDHETRRDKKGVGCLDRGTRKKRSTREEKRWCWVGYNFELGN